MVVSSTFLQLEGRKQQRIVSAALTEFANEGYAGASVNTIVKKTGISKGSLFNYFSDKHGLFMFVFEQALEMVKDYLRRVRDETAAEDLFTRLEKSLMAGVAFIRAHPRVYKIYLRVLYESGLPDRNSLIKSIRRLSIEYLTEFIEVAKSRGEIDPEIDVNEAAFVMEAVLERFLQAYGLQHLDAGLGLYRASDDEAKHWAQGVVRILRTGLAGTGGR
ncbi:MAG: TetR/AcrR family transcriptional regulator [Desulfomonile tiedjei]|nr:TetR/AcrR family transcriptional regulator [Desulfomonile tiedjei]